MCFSQAAERLAQELRSLNNLVSEAFISAVSFDADESDSGCDDEENAGEIDNCKLPPSIRAQHKAGNHMGYNIEYKLLSLEHYDIEASKTCVPNTAAQDLVKKREQEALKEDQGSHDKPETSENVSSIAIWLSFNKICNSIPKIL